MPRSTRPRSSPIVSERARPSASCGAGPAGERIRLALETSTRSPSLALESGGSFLERALSAERPHASDLLPALAELLGELGASPRDLGAVFVGTGPGSYTGLRVGIATALGLARGAGAALFGVPSGETLAWAELEPGEEAAIVLDARGGELYFARYGRTPEGVTVLHAPCVLAAGDLGLLLPSGSRVFADAEAARAAGLERLALHIEPAVPRAGALLALGSRRLAAEGAQDPAQIEPLYLRAFAAKSRRR